MQRIQFNYLTYFFLGHFLPRPQKSVVHTKSQVEDSAFDDKPDDAELVCFDNPSGNFGSFTKKNRLDQIRSRLATVPECSKDTSIFQKSIVSTSTFMFRGGKHRDVTRIGVGLIEKVHGDPSSADARFDIRFCPPKGAKPQQGSKRADTLYQDISADMAFNRSYFSKKGKRIEEEIPC
jgi:hypothetical protein